MFNGSLEAADVRVALVQGQNTLALKAEKPFEVLDLTTNEHKPMAKGKYFVKIENGNLVLENVVFKGAIELLPVDKHPLPSINDKKYDGRLRIAVQDKALLATNTVELEQFLARVLPSKTMPIWPDDAIKAQAVAARTYALYKLQSQKGAAYDLSALDQELSYSGIVANGEKPAITKLIAVTKGQYLVDSSGLPILALTTSSTGGKTEAGNEVLKQNYSYLQSVEDYDNDSPEFTWENRFTPIYVQNMLEQHGYVVGKLTNVRLTNIKEPGKDRSATGRVRYMFFGGTKGAVNLSGSKIMELLGLPSSNFDVETGEPIPDKLKVTIENSYGMEIAKKEIAIKSKYRDDKSWFKFSKSYHAIGESKEERIIFVGKGKGHGVGLSAWGARGMASGEEPKSYEEILAHYYPGTRLQKD